MDDARLDPTPMQRIDLSRTNFDIVQVENSFFEVPGAVETVELRLPDIPATGNTWQLDLPEGAEIVADESYGFREDTVGGGGIRALQLRLTPDAVGKQIIAIQSRPWETDRPPRAHVEINIFGPPPVHPLDA